MLYSRNKRNIAKEDLDFIENSGSLETFQGFFKEETTKQLFELILKHLAFCTKRKACS